MIIHPRCKLLQYTKHSDSTIWYSGRALITVIPSANRDHGAYPPGKLSLCTQTCNMLRKYLFQTPERQPFRLRGHEIGRVEALSDAVFAFSVSLLVVALEVPQTFHELQLILQGALPFFATVSLIFLFWYQQHSFFRHYGLHDRFITLLNLAYLAVILFYVYPLKFLFSILLHGWTGLDLFPEAHARQETVLTPAEFPQLIILFSAGYCAIWLLLAGMYRRAWRYRFQLSLTPYEQAYTQKEIRGACWNAAVGVAATFFAQLNLPGWAGCCYLLIPLLLVLNEGLLKRKRLPV